MSKRKPSPWEAAQREEMNQRRQAEAARKRAMRRHDLTPEQADAVRRARATVQRSRLVVDGASWDQVAAAIDTTRQGAMKRHAAALKRRAE
jgi:hypothetical protein